MGIFSDIEMIWNGRGYSIRSHRVMGAIAQIEDVITFNEIASFMQRGTVPMARLCQGYAAALRYAGAKVTGEDVYAAVYVEPDKQLVVLKAVASMLALALPPAQRAEFERQMAASEDSDAGADSGDPADPPAGDHQPGNRAAAAAASSKTPSNSAVGRRTKVVSA